MSPGEALDEVKKVLVTGGRKGKRRYGSLLEGAMAAASGG